MIRVTAALLGTALLLLGTACSSTHARAVPDVTGQRLDVAEDTLDALGLRYRTAGGGAFGIVVRSHWVVCRQYPPPRTVAKSVLLTVARACTVPDVVGESLEEAKDELEEAGLDVSVHNLDGEPIRIDSYWTVCDQSPGEGSPAQPVELYVADDCSWYAA